MAERLGKIGANHVKIELTAQHAPCPTLVLEQLQAGGTMPRRNGARRPREGRRLFAKHLVIDGPDGAAIVRKRAAEFLRRAETAAH